MVNNMIFNMDANAIIPITTEMYEAFDNARLKFLEEIEQIKERFGINNLLICDSSKTTICFFINRKFRNELITDNQKNQE